jgi:signal transduction histidine kinase
MLYEFIATHREEIIAKTRVKVASRPWPPASTSELENGVPMFLSQLVETLHWESSASPFPATAIGMSATRHGGELLRLGFTVSQVVHDYGDICQAVTELAVDGDAPITTEEFHVLNRCLDTAIAEAVTEHARITDESRRNEELERLGAVTHEMRNRLNTALLAFEIVKRGTVTANGNTAAVLGRSLIALRKLVDGTLADIRMAASQHRPESVMVNLLLEEIGIAARLQAEYCGLDFVVDPVPPELAASVDRQLLESALMNLINNGFKYTRPGGTVSLRARAHEGRVRIEVEDECGGIPQAAGDLFQPFGDRRGKDRTGLGLGLSIARKAVRAQGGDVHVRNLPGQGCVFTIDVPLSAAPAAPEQTQRLQAALFPHELAMVERERTQL